MSTMLRSAARRLGLGHIKRAILGRPKAKPNPNRIETPPQLRSPAARYISITAIFKNEAPYLAEWLEFHRMMGVEHVYLYDNGSTDHPQIVLAPYIDQGFVTVMPWAGRPTRSTPQHLAYAHAISTHGPDWRWMAFIDIDEFLFPVKGDGLPDVLRGYEDLPALGVPWTMYAFCGHETRPAGLTIESYTMRAPFPPSPERRSLFHWKGIVSPARVTAVCTPHDFEFDCGLVGGGYDENRVPLERADRSLSGRTSNVIRLNHYMTRSKAEFAIKLVRSSATLGSLESERKRRQKYADMSGADAVFDGAILRFAPELKKRLAGSSRPQLPTGQRT